MRSLATVLLAGMLCAGCCDENCMAGDSDTDGIDAPDGDDASEGSDCVTSGEGSPPHTDLDACIRAVTCMPPALLAELSAIELCLARERLQDLPGAWGSYEEVVAIDLVMTFLDEINDNAACLSEAETCEAALRCLNGGTDPPPCTTPSTDVLAWGHGCTGNVLSVCMVTVPGTTSGSLFRTDCAEEGRSCVSTPGMSGCMRTDCTSPAGPSCMGELIDHCIQPGAHHVVDCSEIGGDPGGLCGDADPAEPDEQVGCVPVGDPCDPATDGPRCDSETLRFCHEVFHVWIEYDCSELGDWSCELVDGKPGCRPGETDCSLDLEPTCDCDDVLVCDPHSGRDLRIPCPDYGFTTCEAGACI